MDQKITAIAELRAQAIVAQTKAIPPELLGTKLCPQKATAARPQWHKESSTSTRTSAAAAQEM